MRCSLSYEHGGTVWNRGSVEDLKELDEEDIEALAAKLKKVQAKKFAKKIAELRA